MMDDRIVMQEALFYSFSLEDHVPQSHFLRVIDRFVDLGASQRSCGRFTVRQAGLRSIRN